ncbi:MAG TPA: hypothetical protein VGF06_07595 [Terriglobales bacterium]
MFTAPGRAQNAVYTWRIAPMPKSLLRLPCLALGCMLLLMSGAAQAQVADRNPAVQQLAKKIGAIAGHVAVQVTVTNRSSLTQEEVESIRRRLMDQLPAEGLQPVESAAASIQVVLSENFQNYVWVAEIRQGTEQAAVAMISIPRSDTPATGQEQPALALRKLILWTSDAPMLDAAIINGSSPQLVVLHPGEISLYRLQNDHWNQQQTLPFDHPGPWPRDLRGRIVLRKDGAFDAYLPGFLCAGSAGGPVSLSCRASDDPWPAGTTQFGLNAFYAPARNFFTGVLSPEGGSRHTVPAFYTAAPLPRENATEWLFAHTDGRVRTVMLDGLNDQPVSKLPLGSDLATVHSGCASGWQVLATAQTADSRDTIQAFEFMDSMPVAAGQSLDLPGGVTSLWTNAEGDGAVAIVRNASSGKYEAYLLTIACGR